MKDIQGELKKWAQVNGIDVQEQTAPKKKKSQERFTERELQKLMNMDKPTYRRGAGGAIRNR